MNAKGFLTFFVTAAIFVFSVAAAKTFPNDSSEKIAYITIDDGPTLNTPRIMDILEKHKASATFFVLKDRIELYPDYIRRMDAEGFAIGLHGVSHSTDIYSSPTRPLEEMNQCSDALFKLTGTKSKLIRTPYGSSPYLTKRQRELLEAAGYKIFDWSIDPKDSIGERIDKNAVLENLEKGLESGASPAVILLHDRKSTADNLEAIICLLESRGYTLKALEECVNTK